MKSNAVWYEQLKTQAFISLKICIFATFILLVLLIISKLAGKPFSIFSRDPAGIFEVPFYFGFLSYIGIIFWCFTAAICLFSFMLLRNRIKENAFFLLYSGIITLILLLDDIFLLHEMVVPEYLKISQKRVYIIYVLIILLYLIKYWRAILSTEYFLLFFAFGFFGISIIIDIFFEHSIPNRHLFEDGSKFIGIISWFTYFVRVCYNKNATSIVPME